MGGRNDQPIRGSRALLIYGVIGLAGTTLHYIMLIVLVELYGVGSITASCVGFAVGALINHELNRGILFKHTRRSYAASGSRFLITAIVGFLVNLLLMVYLVQSAGLHYFASQLLATVFVFFLTFVINQRWTFGV